ncbi:hypothetical protein K523DRAFT_358515 [Schizophyllum commune Tattone D]|nr:hypothetical protein K523DRAFT_358515 [Schizophyllum commune Tattone D]
MSPILSSPSSPRDAPVSLEPVEPRPATTDRQESDSGVRLANGASDNPGGNANEVANGHSDHPPPGEVAIPSGVPFPRRVMVGDEAVTSGDVPIVPDAADAAEGAPISLAPHQAAPPQDTGPSLGQAAIPSEAILSPPQTGVSEAVMFNELPIAPDVPLPPGEATNAPASGQAAVSDDAVLLHNKEAGTATSGEGAIAPGVPLPVDKAPTALAPDQPDTRQGRALPSDAPARFRELPAARDAAFPRNHAVGEEFAVGRPRTAGVDLQRIIRPFCDHVKSTVSRLQEEVVRADCNCSKRSHESLIAIQDLDKRIRSLESRPIGGLDGARQIAGVEEQAPNAGEGPASASRKRARSVSSQDDEPDTDRCRRRNVDGTAVAARAPAHSQDVAASEGEFFGEGGGFHFKLKWGFKGFNGQ